MKKSSYFLQLSFNNTQKNVSLSVDGFQIKSIHCDKLKRYICNTDDFVMQLKLLVSGERIDDIINRSLEELVEASNDEDDPEIPLMLADFSDNSFSGIELPSLLQTSTPSVTKTKSSTSEEIPIIKKRKLTKRKKISKSKGTLNLIKECLKKEKY